MSTISANTFLAADGTPTTEPSIPALDQRMAKAWIVYDSLTNTINDSYNVSSVSDGGAGVQTVNFTTAMSNASYTTVGNNGEANVRILVSFRTHSTSSFGVRTYDPHTTVGTDNAYNSYVVFGN
jgi:hypothetical protein|tara:strand:+ start:190 stop:561 length:372 start_codon:yes stop_codon:yes gene_type:complete